MKRGLTLAFGVLLIMSLMLLGGCKEKKILHCDRCGLEMKVEIESELEEGMILQCDDCKEDLEATNPNV